LEEYNVEDIKHIFEPSRHDEDASTYISSSAAYSYEMYYNTNSKSPNNLANVSKREEILSQIADHLLQERSALKKEQHQDE